MPCSKTLLVDSTLMILVIRHQKLTNNTPHVGDYHWQSSSNRGIPRNQWFFGNFYGSLTFFTRVPHGSHTVQAQLRGICVVSSGSYGLREANCVEERCPISAAKMMVQSGAQTIAMAYNSNLTMVHIHCEHGVWNILE